MLRINRFRSIVATSKMTLVLLDLGFVDDSFCASFHNGFYRSRSSDACSHHGFGRNTGIKEDLRTSYVRVRKSMKPFPPCDRKFETVISEQRARQSSAHIVSASDALFRPARICLSCSETSRKTQ